MSLVISEARSNSLMLWKESVWIFRNKSDRNSAPKFCDTMLASMLLNEAATAPHAVINNIKPPIFNTYSMFLCATPTSMIFDIIIGCIKSQSASHIKKKTAVQKSIQYFLTYFFKNCIVHSTFYLCGNHFCLRFFIHLMIVI
ncbi:hypothetical protein B4064_3735 [Caldibacillus thermoamylovorans]|nr:hypothetical protein B4065_3947 [Caldibacillus thermoamylovorans]KIO58326.1 hypothetical protein B4064_3735 [Caldibacillus thermoamylovorans]